jgi:signal transduction histidine kinase/CheY-like chemotaxis protein
MLEDNPLDAELAQELLEADQLACEITRVQSRPDFVAALQNPAFDIILADYMLPSFDGLTALGLAREARPDLPFIFVSGTLGEEVAIEALKIGATDYVVKSRLSRLVHSVHRALDEARERVKRKEVEEALRQSEMYLAEAQRLSHTGSFGWDPATGEIYWSEETYRIFACEPTITPSVEFVLERTHPDDRERLAQILTSAANKSEFVAEHRLVMPDGSIKFARSVAHRSGGKDSARLLFVGAITDITEHKQAEEAQERLRGLEADLARLDRISMMGELAASLAHEIKQPIAAAVIHAAVLTRRLRRDAPELGEAHHAAEGVAEAMTRASGIIDRVSSMYRRGTTEREAVDLNGVVREMIALLDNLASRSSVSICQELAPELPGTTADRIQLQQVLMNLMLNGIEAMQSTGGTLTVSSKQNGDGQLVISVGDSGGGFSDADLEHIFDAFFTTKPKGTGMGLSVSRRIIAAHGGRLWARHAPSGGAIFEFALPPR